VRSLGGAVAVVTGAGSGIGRAVAQTLAAKGCALALCDVNVAGLAETQASIGDSVRTTTRHVDVANLEEMTAFRDAVANDFGRVSVLINNAGVALYGRFTELSFDDFEWIMGINFWGAVYGCKLFLPLLLEEPEANIVTLSSVYGIVAPPLNSGYCASKFAVRGFSETLRHELALSNVRLTVVHPGGINTNIARTTRIGEKADAKKYAADSAEFQKKLTATPAYAAEKIVGAVLSNRPRLLIGGDAKMLDLIQRFWPARYMTVLGPILDPKKQFRE
jgi:NAD(P)-dependent dehydrogenase (short-subunit alcohol dehydrogenase family)